MWTPLSPRPGPSRSERQGGEGTGPGADSELTGVRPTPARRDGWDDSGEKSKPGERAARGNRNLRRDRKEANVEKGTRRNRSSEGSVTSSRGLNTSLQGVQRANVTAYAAGTGTDKHAVQSRVEEPGKQCGGWAEKGAGRGSGACGSVWSSSPQIVTRLKWCVDCRLLSLALRFRCTPLVSLWAGGI